MEPIFGLIVLFFAIKGAAGTARSDPSQARPGSGLWRQEMEQARQRWIERSRVHHDRKLNRIQLKGEQKKESDRVKGEEWLSNKSERMQAAAAKREAYAAKHGRPWKSTADYLAETAKDVAGHVGAAAERGAGKLAETARERQLEREAWRRNERETLPNDPAPSQPDSATPPAEGSTQPPGGGDYPGPTDDAGPTDNVVPLNRNRTQQGQGQDDTNGLTEQQQDLVRKVRMAISFREAQTLTDAEWKSLPVWMRARLFDEAYRNGVSSYFRNADGERVTPHEADPEAAALMQELTEKYDSDSSRPAPNPEKRSRDRARAQEMREDAHQQFMAEQQAKHARRKREQDAAAEQTDDTEPSAEEHEHTAAGPDGPAPENATSTETDTESGTEGEATPMTEQDAPTAPNESETASHAEITSLDGAYNYAQSMMRFLENTYTRLEQLQAEIESLEQSVTQEYYTQEVALASLANEGLESSDVAEFWTQGQAHMEQVSAAAEAMNEKSAELGESLQTSWGCYADASEKLDEQRPLQEQLAAQDEKNTADSTKFFEYA